MGKDKLEHSIKSKLSTYESSVNTDSLWAGIQAGMGVSANGTEVAATATATTAAATALVTKKAIIGLSIATIALITIGSLWYFNSNALDENSESKIETITVPTYANSELEKQEAIVEKEISTQLKHTTIQNKASLDETTSPNKNTTYIDTKSTLSNTSIKNNSTSRNAYAGNISNENTTADISRSTSTALGLTQKENIEVNNENTSTIEVVNNSASSNNNSIDIITDDSNSNVSSDIMKVENSAINYSLVEGNDLMNLDLKENDYSLNLELPKKKIECPSFRGSSNSGGVFIGELQAIPYYSIPRITATSDEGELWKERKLASESYLETFQLNLVGRYQMSNGLYAHAGIGYGQLDEKFDYQFEETFVTQEEIPVTIIIRPNGDNDTIPGQGEVTQDSTFIASTYNYHRMVEFTAAVGYEFAVNSNLSIYGDVGMSINIFTTRSGFHALGETDVIEFSDESRPVFKSSTGYKLTGGVGLRYYAGNGVVLSAGPEFRSHLSNWIRDEHPIELKYLDIGFRMGVGYMF